LSNEQSEKVSRNEEIRAIFIFGLLAVFAYVKIQYPTLTLTYPNGSINLIFLIDIIIIFWSLYAFFMVLGLSEDTIGKSFAYMFRELSKLFLQVCFILLGVISFIFGFTVYDLRFLLGLFVILTALVVYVYLTKRPKFSLRLSSLRDTKQYFRSVKTRKNLRLILGLSFSFSVVVVLQYPKSWFESTFVVLAAFVVAVVAVSLIIAFEKSKDDEMEDYYNIDYILHKPKFRKSIWLIDEPH
jgi:hypothetical protein